jgi:hypothetical protein
MLPGVEGFFRRPRAVSDARPPAPPRRSKAQCAVCGLEVTADQAIDRGHGIQHLVCEPTTVTDLDRRLEASRALHRAFTTLGAIAQLEARVAAEAKRVPDVADASEVLASLVRLRTAVELASFSKPEQRRLSLALLDGLAAKLGAPDARCARSSAPPPPER